MPGAIDAQIRRGCEHIRIPVRTMHKIRKTCVSTLLHNSVNLSIVKDMLGHADETTIIKHYIYKTEDTTETDNKALTALQPLSPTKSDQNLIPYPKQKRAELLETSRHSTLSQ